MKKSVCLTISLLLAFSGAAEAKNPDRGLGNPRRTYISKGTWAVGASFGFNQYKSNEGKTSSGASLVGLVSGLSGNATLIEGGLSGSYFVKDNLSVGLRFNYANTSVHLDEAKILNSLSLGDRHYVRENFTGAIAVRQYIPLFNSKVFALFAEGRLNGSIGYDKDYETLEVGKVGTYGDIYSVSLGLYPGVSLFLTNFLTVELSLPLLEGGYEWNPQVKNAEENTRLSHSFFNFKPGLLGLNLGLVFHF